MALLGTGLRLGELLGLRIEDVRLSPDPVLRVARTMHRDGTFAGPRTARSRRTIALAPSTAALFDRLIAGKQPDALVFTKPGGGPWKAGTLRQRYWQPAPRAVSRIPGRSPGDVGGDLREPGAGLLVEVGGGDPASQGPGAQQELHAVHVDVASGGELEVGACRSGGVQARSGDTPAPEQVGESRDRGGFGGAVGDTTPQLDDRFGQVTDRRQQVVAACVQFAPRFLISESQVQGVRQSPAQLTTQRGRVA
ncbi:hypothetical protein GCM10010434_099520 [Winogradskya humida]